MGRRIQLLMVFVSFFILYTSYKVAQLWPLHPLGAIVISTLLFVVMLGGTILLRSDAELYDQLWFRTLSWAGSLALGLWATFFILSFPIDLLNFIVFAIGKINPSLEINEESRSSAVSAMYVALALLSVGFSFLGYLEVHRGARVKMTNIPTKDLAPQLNGFKIAQVTDLHIGTTIRAGYVNEVVERTNALNPDIIVLTGDIVDGHPESVVEHVKPLSQLKANYGVYYVTGNHEYFWGVDQIIELMRRNGVIPLLNEHKVFDVKNCRLMVAGVTDHRPNIASALRTSESVQYKILLVHKPGVQPQTESFGVNLQIAGHTHAGQFFPFSLFIGLAHKYSRGLYRHNDLWVYVNPGTGYWGPANRFTVSPEISLLTLES